MVGVPVALPEAVTSTSSKSQKVSESPIVQAKSTVVVVSSEAAKAVGSKQDGGAGTIIIKDASSSCIVPSQALLESEFVPSFGETPPLFPITAP